ncbi:MAG: sulfite exporter TauE/SafE family protein [Flavobacteriales bacterium]|nr:sulfite exporter TauE/SafE family protein [Flavobacteriales bacterium]
MEQEIAWWIFTLSGFLVGSVVGMTGVGGGSLMTPILLYLGIPAIKAVTTDLLYAGLTKAGGVFAHFKQKTINWKITLWMSLGSITASLLTIAVLVKYDLHGMNEETEELIRYSLAFALLLTSITMMVKHKLKLRKINKKKKKISSKKKLILTVVTGFLIGVLVTISSIGAGAIGTVILFSLYPTLSTKRIVGTDIAHAVPLTLIAGISHMMLDENPVKWDMLFFLLLGSLPGIYIGSFFAGRISDKFLKPFLAVMLFIIAISMIFK